MTINRLEILYRVGKQLQDCTHARLARAELKPVWTDFESDGNAKWTLDLSSTALFGPIFQGWGLKHPRVEVLCDESKPLMAVSEHFDGFVGREEHLEITDGLRKVPVRGNLVKPIGLAPPLITRRFRSQTS